MTREEFIAEIEAFLHENSMAPSRFGLLAMNDSSFVLRLRNGFRPKMGTPERVRRFMREYRPAEALGAAQNDDDKTTGRRSAA